MSLTDLESVKQFLQVEESDEEQDAIIESLISRCSAAFASYTHREFEKADAEARVFAHPGGTIFDLGPYDLRDLTTIEVGTQEGASSPAATLTAGEFALRPLPARHGVYQRIKLTTDPGACEITVTGDWGFEEVPEDVQHWAISTVAVWLRREVQAFERTFSIDEARLERPEALPSAVRGGLATYRRPALP